MFLLCRDYDPHCLNGIELERLNGRTATAGRPQTGLSDMRHHHWEHSGSYQGCWTSGILGTSTQKHINEEKTSIQNFKEKYRRQVME